MLNLDVINLARLQLNDDAKTRVTDLTALAFLNNYVQEAVKNRPDLFIGSFLRLPASNLLLSDTFPMPSRYERACADYIIARAAMLNTEEGALEKANAYLTLSAEESGL